MQTTTIDQRAGQSDHGALACLRRVDCLSQAGLSHCRDGKPAPHGHGSDLCASLALFTLVGMAGEYDLDAPDLTACGVGAGGEARSWRHRPAGSRDSGNGRLRSAIKSNTAAVLDTGQSAALRDKLLAEVASLTSTEHAVTWATQALPAKNSLIAADAKLLKEAFEQKLSGLSSGVVEETSAPPWHRG